MTAMKHIRLIGIVLIVMTIACVRSVPGVPTPPSRGPTPTGPLEFVPQGELTEPSAVPGEMAPQSAAETPSVPQPDEPVAGEEPGNRLSLPLVFGLSPRSDQESGDDAWQDALAAELRNLVISSLPPTATPDANGDVFFEGISDVSVQRLRANDSAQPLWAVSSLGYRNFEPLQSHFVAIYTYGPDGWRELSRANLVDPDTAVGVAEVPFAGPPGSAWLEAGGVAGVHGGCYNLLHFDGQALRVVLENCNSSPGAGWTQDLNGDGTPEVILDLTEYYVFCYACGVTVVNYEIWRFQDGRLEQVQLADLPRPADAALIELNDRAVNLARGELWKDARLTIQQARQLDPANPITVWNAAIIETVAAARQEVLNYSGHPLLSQVIYGDYAAAVDLMRPYSPAEIFNAQGPLIAGSAAEGWLDSLVDHLDTFTNRATQANYNLAAAHFIRAWGLYLQNADVNRITFELEMAAQIDPNEALYARCLSYFQ